MNRRPVALPSASAAATLTMTRTACSGSAPATAAEPIPSEPQGDGQVEPSTLSASRSSVEDGRSVRRASDGITTLRVAGGSSSWAAVSLPEQS